MRTPRFRYSLRALLVVMTLVGAGCYYALLPWTRAASFTAAVRAHRAEAAAAMLGSFPSGPHYLAIEGAYPMDVEPVTLAAVWRGEARIYIRVPDDFDMPGGTWFRATRSGVYPGPITW